MSLVKPFTFLLIIAAVILLLLASTTSRALGPAFADLAPASSAPLTPEEEVWREIETYTTVDSHALTKHPEAAADVRRCLDNGLNPTYRLWVRSSKRIDICDLLDGYFGFRVWKQIGGNSESQRSRPSVNKIDNQIWSERTAYIRSEIRSEVDLINYARSEGWTLQKMVNNEWINLFEPITF